ncbi:MAG TPA: DUF3221 domain-containing protein [Clostridia bacterium]|nr:DUF3221 domain-containing protein [Clostridia bacterium]
MRKSTVFLLTLVIALALLGCSGGDAGQEIDIKGKITEVIVGDGGDVTGILVEGNPGDGEYDKARVRIDEETRILEGKDGENLTSHDLKKGLTVEVIFTGPVAESYPVQATANDKGHRPHPVRER